MRALPFWGIIVASLLLQGCVALALPAVAAGVIGKKEIDKGRERAKAAENSFDPTVPPEVIVGTPPSEPSTDVSMREAPAGKTEAGGDDVETVSAINRLAQSDIQNVYLPFARYALDQAERRARGEFARGAVLVENVSLSAPKTMDCGNRPMAAIIDLDVAPGTPAEMDVERQNGFSVLLETMRESGIRIAWLAETDQTRLKPILDLLREGNEPVIRDADLMLVGLPGGYRKQERRWQLARDYCVVAIAGDRRGDFDELYDYLRDQSYAIRLDAFIGKGWFELPHPVAAIDSERLQVSPDKKAGQ
jgi:hypothetical protein